MKNIKSKFATLLAFIFLVSSCETTDLDLRESPNGASPDDANVALLLNGAMNNFREFNEDATNFGMQVSRMTHMYGPVYDNAYAPTSFNDLWTNAYAGVMADTRSIIENGTKAQLFEHVAVAKILQSYTLTTLVDLFGKVPYSKAISFSDDLNPTVDDDQQLYTDALGLLDSAIEDFGKTSLQSLTKADDIFYGGKKANWVTLANTLKLRIYNNSRLASFDLAKVNALITENDFILEPSQDFEIKYGTQDNDPDIRHFKFRQSYLGDGGEYMSTYFMNLLYSDKEDPDPRMKYYFYRQSSEYPDPSTSEGLFTMPCLGKSKPTHYGFKDPFCKIGEGYWGRDHGDNDGGPPDGNKITVWGLYPAGGKYDIGDAKQASQTDGAKGKGILPLWNVANTYFTLSELALTEGTNGDAKDLLEKGVKASIKKVLEFNTDAIPSSASTPSTAAVDAYVSEVLTNYDDATSDDSRLNIIMKESFISNWGNGIEVYNGYRRTGKPSNLQPTLSATPGNFIHSFSYPANLVNRNSNVSPKTGVDVRVFWDKNTDNLNF